MTHDTPLPEHPSRQEPGDEWPEWAERFLEALRSDRVVLKAAEKVSLSRQAVYDWRKKSPSFATAWDEALESDETQGLRILYERAFVGWIEPIWWNGQIVGHQRKYDARAALAFFKLWTGEKGTARKGQPPTPAEIAAAVHDFERRAMATVPDAPEGPAAEGPKP